MHFSPTATSPKVTPPQLDGRPTETDDATGPLPRKLGVHSETLLVIGPSAYSRAEPVLPTDS
jgi:hypothetical protein